jgi:hypothetical protein
MVAESKMADIIHVARNNLFSIQFRIVNAFWKRFVVVFQKKRKNNFSRWRTFSKRKWRPLD